MIRDRYSPYPDFGDVPNPRDISPHDVYCVGTKINVRVNNPNTDPADWSPYPSLDLEIVQQIKVAPDRRSQIVIARINGRSNNGIASDANSLVIKFFDPVYLAEKQLSGHRSRVWTDRVEFASEFCEAEFKAYQALSELQGRLIPICYGTVTHIISSDGREERNVHEVPGILLQNLPVKSYVFGHQLPNVDARTRFVDQADAILQEVLRIGVSHNDTEPRNFCVDDSGRMYLLDFEHAKLLNSDTEKAKNESMIEQINFESNAKLYGFLPKDVDWKYKSALKVCNSPLATVESLLICL
jgi:hypothetical protein